ncbi:aldose 1-epimerase family protein [Rhodococcus sp. NPDC127530]|uniref:aldose 1-epimerase family protein n=1 Tax=unclassified Rhodococcus (in: high G+C Gram-positive bacteria) TaxID=192944 RepID=UPI00362AD827
MTDRTLLRNGRLTAAVNPVGAELCSLRNAADLEMLWQAGPEWPRHAPVLFPVIGRMADDILVHNGMRYPMPQHGFARDVEFARVAVSATSAHFRLTDTARTDRYFPFSFVLDVQFDLGGDELSVTYRIGNPSSEATLPASIGVHPAFRWPLHDGDAKGSYRLEFSDLESAPVRRVDNVLLRADDQPNPVQGSSLPLHPGLFRDGAVILDQLSSTAVRYQSDDGEGLTLSWSGFEQLAIWSPPDDTDLLCIEPWFGLPSPADFDGEYRSKPAQLHLGPGQEREFGLRISLSRKAPGPGARPKPVGPHAAPARDETDTQNEDVTDRPVVTRVESFPRQLPTVLGWSGQQLTGSRE